MKAKCIQNKFSQAALVLLGALGLSAAAANAAASPAPGVLPPSRQGLPATAPARVGAQLLAALNTGTTNALEEFLDAHLGHELLNQMSREKYSHQLRRLQEESRGLDFKRTFSADATTARLLVSSREGNHPLGLEIVVAPADPRRAVWLGLHQLPGTGPQPAPLPSAVSSSEAQIAAVRAYVGQAAQLGQFSGSVLVARGKDILLSEAWGKVDARKSEPLRPDSLYNSASVGKMFTAVAIAQLVEQGKLAYSDTIGKWLPDYPNAETAAKVTVHHLLTHTGGLGDPFDSPLMARRDTFKTQADWFVTFADQPPRFAAGDHHEYSNGGYVVLAAIVEKVSGLKFANYLREHVFGPAGMSHTGALEPAARVSVAVPHTHPALDDPLGIEPRRPKADSALPTDGVGMGGWTTSTLDLFHFGRALREGRLVSAESLKMLTTGKVPVMRGAPAQYAYGFYVIPLGNERLVGHSGGGGDLGFGAEFKLLWDADYTIVILSNYDLPETEMLTRSIAAFLAKGVAQYGVGQTHRAVPAPAS